MPDNVKQEKKVEENKSTKVQENEKSGVFKEFDDLKSNVEQGKKDSKAERNTIENILKRADDKVQERKKELFLEKLNKEMEGKVSEPITFDKLTVEQRRDFDNFEIPEDELEKLYNEHGTAKEIEDLTSQRNEQLDSLGTQIDDFYKKLEQEISDRKEQLNTVKDEKERQKIQDEIDKIEGIKNELGAKKEDKSPIRQTLAQAFNNHDEARMNAVNGLMLVYSENIVRKDKDFINKVVPDKNKEEFEKGAKAQEQEPQGVPGQGNPAKGGMGIPFAPNGQSAAENKNQVVGEKEEEEKKPTGMDYLTKLGYDPSNITAKNSKQMLDAFVNADPAQQLKIITDKDSQEALFTAIKKANGRMTPVFAIKFNKTRDALLKMANDSMIRESLKAIGVDTKDIDNKEELGKVFDEEVRKYNEEKSGIEQMLENIEDPQERKELQTKLDDLDKKYSSISGANEFRDMTSKELNKIKNRIAENFDYNKTKTIAVASVDDKRVISGPRIADSDRYTYGKSNFKAQLEEKSNSKAEIRAKDAMEASDKTKVNVGPNKKLQNRDEREIDD